MHKIQKVIGCVATPTQTENKVYMCRSVCLTLLSHFRSQSLHCSCLMCVFPAWSYLGSCSVFKETLVSQKDHWFCFQYHSSGRVTMHSVIRFLIKTPSFIFPSVVMESEYVFLQYFIETMSQQIYILKKLW